MNKQSLLALHFIAYTALIHSQAGPVQKSSNITTLHDLERETFDAVVFSKDLEPLPLGFCKNVLESAPQEVQDDVKLLLNPKTRSKVLPCSLIFFGPPGSGKTTLARVIAQEMNVPFVIVKASQLHSEYANSGTAGLKRVSNLITKLRGTLIIDEMDSVTKRKDSKDHSRTEDETPRSFWLLLDDLREKKLLFIGTTNDISGMPPQLQNRLSGFIYEIPYLHDPALIQKVIERSQGEAILDSEVTLKKIIRQVRGISNREIDKLIYLALKNALQKNPTAPVITFSDFQEALSRWRKDKKALKATPWDKKEIFNYTTQTISAISSIMSILNGLHSMTISSTSLRLAQSVAQFNEMNANRTYNLGVESKEIAQESLDHTEQATKASQAATAKSLRLQKHTRNIAGGGVLVGAAGVGVAAKAIGLCVIV